ncbi:hypothetical protein JM16_008609 [Phytophthora kernoviae]|uniref:Guanylate cyclase domain-containing protein n=1 Tax=Phytophthora kernoviae TaxID=325452 RepID=A0A8T0LKI4_9STRA|nr:hypothetical protein JM16_008609 [Phytophthora kernoviae]
MDRAETVVAAVNSGYTTYTQGFQLAVYFAQFASFFYMLFVVAKLKWGGRKYENVQGQFITSPIYQRLSRIMTIYALFTLQYQLASVITYSSHDDNNSLSYYMGISAVIYNISGSQMEARLMQPGDLLSPRDTQVLIESAEPPLVNPVFVFTDIQQSSALWGAHDGLIMQRATEIHDNILRSSLMKYRGYEITTAGDAFQLAFHTVREAIEYCVDVQMKLLDADWPKELHELIPATKKQRVHGRLIFRGLRVRMGIHDAVDSDGTLVLDVHAVTGKMTYTGASEVIANEIGDLGDGGQILVTKRVADWLHMYEDLVSIPCSVDRVGEYTVPQINSTVEVFQVVPTELSQRKKKFTSTLKRRAPHPPVYPGAAGPSSFHDSTPPGLSSVAAQRRRHLYAKRERRRRLEQGALGRPASHQALLRVTHGTGFSRTTSIFSRVLFMIVGAIKPLEFTVHVNDEVIQDRYSKLGVFSVLHFKVSHDGLVTTLLVMGDCALFAVAIWTFPLAYELGEIAARSMDRGAEKEGEQIRWYLRRVWLIIAVFVLLETVLAGVKGGYTVYTQRCLLAVYFTQFTSFLYMIWVVIKLKIGGRKYENVQGQFVTSPIYQRLSRIMIIYGVFNFQFQLTTVIMYAMPQHELKLVSLISVSAVVYCVSGLALAVTTMCNQACVLKVCRCCLPDDIEAQVEARLLQPGELLSPQDTMLVLVESAEPPLVNPVFVFTDIKQSSALWGVGDGLIMQRATEVHDNILRSSLMKYRGYEITTAGDAFQLAFHTVREAVEYCLDVQMQLMEATWPTELHGLIPATKKQRARGRLIFCGLRVRMGIHDAMDTDGPLVLDVHAVTGKMIYTGASEVIANEIGDVGDGGQILVTRRVADWLHMYQDLVAIPCSVDRVGEYTVPMINAPVEVFQVMSIELGQRKKKFTTTLKKLLQLSVDVIFMPNVNVVDNWSKVH